MDKFGAEFQRHIEARQVSRPAAATDPVARLEDEHAPACARKLRCGGKPGRARAEDDDFRVRYAHECKAAPPLEFLLDEA